MRMFPIVVGDLAQPLDDDGILVPFVLDKEGVLRLVNEMCDPLAPVVRAPDTASSMIVTNVT
jgi:hypothetical protein